MSNESNVAQEAVAWQYQRIGSGRWIDCNKRYYEHVKSDPLFITRELVESAVAAAPGIDLATAWAEGYESGVMDERISEANIGIAGFGAKVAPARANPYLIDASPKGGSDALTIPEPHLECYSNNDGDSWYEHPADYELVQGLKVGDTYTLDVSHYSVERTYRVTKAPDETSEDYEVEPVQATSAEVGDRHE